MKRRIGLSLVGAIVLAVVAPHLITHTSAVAGARQESSTVKAEEVLPLTCVQAWVASGKNYPEMLDAGRGIAEDCKADPNALLFAVVDHHVRRVAESAPVR